MRRANLVIAGASAAVGLLALGFTLASGQVFALGTVLGVVLLANGVIRYLMAQRQ